MAGAVLVLYAARRDPTLALILGVAYLLRSGAALFHFYVAPLPGSAADAHTFESTAWEFAHKGVISLVTGIEPDSYFVSRVLGVLYAVTDRSPLMAQALSVGMGTGSIYLLYRLATLLWTRPAAIKAAWVAAFFPSLILYSALTLREAYIWFFFLLGTLGVVYWMLGHLKKGFILAVAGFTVVTFFHGAMFLTLLAFFGLLTFKAARQLVARLQAGFVRPTAMLVVVLSVGVIGSYAIVDYRVHKLGTLEDLTNVHRLLYRMHYSSRDAASYPDWLVPDTPLELAVLAPVRVVYFLFAPFPWDVKATRHLIGWADGMLYMALSFLVWRNRRAIWRNDAARAALLVALPAFLVFAIAIGNFGTGVRHRTKVLELALVMAAPVIPRLVLNKKALQKA